MAKSKKQEELESRAHHPAGKGKGGGKSLIDAQATVYATAGGIPNDPEAEILQVWVKHLTTAALLQHMEKLINQPKGWKKAQREALIKEFWVRFEILWGAFNHINDICLSRQRGYDDHLNGDVLNKQCMDDVVNAVVMYQQEIR